MENFLQKSSFTKHSTSFSNIIQWKIFFEKVLIKQQKQQNMIRIVQIKHAHTIVYCTKIVRILLYEYTNFMTLTERNNKKCYSSKHLHTSELSRVCRSSYRTSYIVKITKKKQICKTAETCQIDRFIAKFEEKKQQRVCACDRFRNTKCISLFFRRYGLIFLLHRFVLYNLITNIS